MLYGAPAQGRARRRAWLRRMFLPLALAPFLAGLAGLILIDYVVDPYAIHPWGLAPRLADDHLYPDAEWPLLLRAATRQDHRLVLIGASTMMGASPQDLADAFGADTRPVNLAYPQAHPGDTRVVVDAVAAMPQLRRVLFVMDLSFMTDLNERGEPARLRERVFSSDWAHASDFRWDTLVGSWHRLADGVYDRPGWKALQQPEFLSANPPMPQRPAMMTVLRNVVAQNRATVLGHGFKRDCRVYPFLDAVLVPALAKLRARRVAVDLVFPPYPYGYYYYLINRHLPDRYPDRMNYAGLMEFKRCVVDIADRFGPGVTVHAMDNDAAIAGQIGNYFDLAHLSRPEAYRSVIRHIARRDSVLTRNNFDAFERALRAHVLSYRM
jgi:hypothetical protein